jgi:hypothetical protein
MVLSSSSYSHVKAPEFARWFARRIALWQLRIFPGLSLWWAISETKRR